MEFRVSWKIKPSEKFSRQKSTFPQTPDIDSDAKLLRTVPLSRLDYVLDSLRGATLLCDSSADHVHIDSMIIAAVW